MNYKYLFWDNDGILVDTEKVYMQACRETLKTVGYDLSDAEFQEVSLHKGESVFDLVDGLAETKKDELRKYRDDLYTKLLSQGVEPLPHVVDILDTLHGKIPMCIVTSAKKEHFYTIHEQTGLLKYFEFVLAREDFVDSKPNPEPYLKAQEKAGVFGSDGLAFEDSYRGMLSAKDAGLDCFALPHSLSENADFSRADKVLKCHSEILKALNL